MVLELPDTATVFEVAPRDGLQNERVLLSVQQRVALIDHLSAAGFTNIEIGSFVSPRWIPQMAGTAEVLAGIERRPGTRYWVLVPNRRGFSDALAAGAECVSVFMSSSEGHNRSNVNRSVAESLTELRGILREARAAGLLVRAYLSTVFGCPYDGPVDPGRVVELSHGLLEAGAWQVSLGDTIGVAHPRQVVDMVERVSRVAPPDRFALHFHDTRGIALANVLAGLQAGIRVFDASLSGVGGCPYAPGASGNLATEDMLNLLHASGIETGVSLERAAACGLFLRELLNHDLPGRYHSWFLGRRRIGEGARSRQGA